MGGFDTAISASTKNILIESAWFDPATVRKTARRLGMHTDASHIFERGADWGATPLACNRVAELILSTAGGELEGDAVDAIAGHVPRYSLILRRSGNPADSRPGHSRSASYPHAQPAGLHPEAGQGRRDLQAHGRRPAGRQLRRGAAAVRILPSNAKAGDYEARGKKNTRPTCSSSLVERPAGLLTCLPGVWILNARLT